MSKIASNWGYCLAAAALFSAVAVMGCQQSAPAPGPTTAAKPAATTALASPSATAAPAKAAEPAKPAAAADPKITIKLGHTQNPGTAIDEAANRLAKKAADMSSGSIEVKVYGAMSLGSEREQIEQVQTGSIDMGVFASDYLANLEPSAGAVSLPFVVRDLAHIHKVMDGPVGDELKDNILKKSKLRSVATYDYSFRNTMTQTKAIKALPDFAGIKIRVMENPTVIQTWKLLGANPVPMPWNEVYSAMQTKVIDAMEAPPESMTSIKIQEVGKYLTLTGHQFLVSHVIIRDATWERLTPNQKKVMNEVMADSQTFQRDFAEKANQASLDQLKSGGVQVFEIDKAPLQQAVKPVYQEFAKSIGGIDYVEKILAVK